MEFLQVNASDNGIKHTSAPANDIVIIRDDAGSLFKVIVLCVMCMSLSIFGIMTNVINIICFAKQGFQDSVNVNFLALAVSDLGSQVTAVFGLGAYLEPLQQLDQAIHFEEVIYLAFGWPHLVFGRITGWITALVTLERCLCITMPIKVRSFITPRRATVINISLYIIIIVSVSPVYYVNNFGWKFSPERNRTIFGLVFTDDREQVEQIVFTLNHVIIPFTAFILVIVCTITLVMSLRTKSKWRETSSDSRQARKTSSRDQKLGQTIVAIATVFIVSYIPICLTFVAAIFVPGLSFTGHNKNLFTLCTGMGVLLEEINSSVNIFIYYHMSSKYRQVFLNLLSQCELKK